MNAAEIRTAIHTASEARTFGEAPTEKQVEYLASLYEAAFAKSKLAGESAAFYLASMQRDGLTKRGASSMIESAKAW